MRLPFQSMLLLLCISSPVQSTVIFTSFQQFLDSWFSRPSNKVCPLPTDGFYLPNEVWTLVLDFTINPQNLHIDSSAISHFRLISKYHRQLTDTFLLNLCNRQFSSNLTKRLSIERPDSLIRFAILLLPIRNQPTLIYDLAHILQSLHFVTDIKIKRNILKLIIDEQFHTQLSPTDLNRLREEILLPLLLSTFTVNNHITRLILQIMGFANIDCLIFYYQIISIQRLRPETRLIIDRLQHLNDISNINSGEFSDANFADEFVLTALFFA